MTPEGHIHLSQALCLIGLIPFLMLGLAWLMGCLRAVGYFFYWLRRQSVSTRWLMLTFPLLFPGVSFLGLYQEDKTNSVVTCGVIFTLLLAIVVASAIFISGVLHTYPAVERVVSGFRRIQRWHKIVLIGFMIDLILFPLLRLY